MSRAKSPAQAVDTVSLRHKSAYLEHLAFQGKLATETRDPDAPTVVSTFSSAGGSSLGYHMAGMRELLAVEWDNNKVATFKANFPDVPVFHGDIHDLPVEQALEMAGVEPGELTIFDGSPPCQGFSTAGHRILEDPRNSLFTQYVRLLEGFKPKAFIFENVKGMIVGNMKPVFRQIMDELSGCGYRIRAQIINAANFGVPQNRHRLFITGIREDLNIEPPILRGTMKPVTVGEACLDANTDLPPRNLESATGKLWGHIEVGRKLSNIHPRGSGYTAMLKLNPRKPARTLVALTTMNGFGTYIHWSDKRPISIGEAKRLTSFPDEYKILPTPQLIGRDYATAWKAIGDCVPPFMAAEVARQVLAQIEEK